MIDWLMDNIANIVALLILALILFFVIRKMVRDKKAGKTTCSCGCSNCAVKDNCHSKNKS